MDAKLTDKGSINPRLAIVSGCLRPMLLLFSIIIGSGVILYYLFNPPEFLEIEWTAEGEWLLYNCGLFAHESESSLYIMRPDGSEVQRITPNSYVAHIPSWSPDGEWIAFIDSQTWREDVYIMRPDGSDTRFVLSSSDSFSGVSGLAWRPKSSWIAVALGSEIQLLNTANDETRVLYVEGDYYYNLEWSPDGRYLAFKQTNSSNLIQLVLFDIEQNDYEILFTEINFYAIEWAGDGKSLWFIHWLSDGERHELIRYDIEDGSVQEFELPIWSTDFAISPDGTRMASFDNNHHAYLYQMPSETGDFQLISEYRLPRASCWGFDWISFEG